MRAKVVVAGLVVSIVLASCGEHKDARVVVTLDHVASETTAAKTARVAVTITSEDDYEEHQEGVFDFSAKSGSMRYDDVGIDGQKISTTIVHSAVYMPMVGVGDIDRDDPCFAKKWAVFDYPKYAREGLDVEADQSPLPLDPDEALAALKRGDAVLTEIGTDDIRGERATHWRVAGATGVDPWFTRGLDEEKRTLTALDIWVDAEARLRRARWVVHVVMSPAYAAVAPDFDETTTVDVWDYGVAVNVTKPADSDVCDFPEFFGRTMSTFD